MMDDIRGDELGDSFLLEHDPMYNMVGVAGEEHVVVMDDDLNEVILKFCSNNFC